MRTVAFLVLATAVWSAGPLRGANCPAPIQPAACSSKVILTARHPELFKESIDRFLNSLMVGFEMPRPRIREISRGVFALELPTPQLAALVTLKLRDDQERFIDVEQDATLSVHGRDPLDSLFPKQWGLTTIGAPDAWMHHTGSGGIVVAVVDSGVEESHPDLTANIWHAPAPYTVTVNGASLTCAKGTWGLDAVTSCCNADDDYWHGTSVAGIIGARADDAKASTGMAGVNWETSILPVRFIQKGGFGCATDAIVALEYVRQMKEDHHLNIQVVNASWGGPTETAALRAKFDELVLLGMVIVASAGNDGVDIGPNPHYPASWADGSQILAVAASRKDDDIFSDSNIGPTTVHIAAPGFELISTFLRGKYACNVKGTSFAAPHVSGAIALTMAACPSLSAKEAAALILSEAETPTELTGQVIGGRRLAVDAAIAKCVSASSPLRRAASPVNAGASTPAIRPQPLY
jgi:serine protease